MDYLSKLSYVDIVSLLSLNKKFLMMVSKELTSKKISSDDKFSYIEDEVKDICKKDLIIDNWSAIDLLDLSLFSDNSIEAEQMLEEALVMRENLLLLARYLYVNELVEEIKDAEAYFLNAENLIDVLKKNYDEKDVEVEKISKDTAIAELLSANVLSKIFKKGISFNNKILHEKSNIHDKNAKKANFRNF